MIFTQLYIQGSNCLRKLFKVQNKTNIQFEVRQFHLFIFPIKTSGKEIKITVIIFLYIFLGNQTETCYLQTMYFSIQHEPYFPFMVSTSHLRGTLVSSTVKENDALRRRRALKRVDRELYKGNFKSALSLVKHLQGKPGGLRGFGAAKQVSLYIFIYFLFGC